MKLILATCPTDQAQVIARTLVGSQLAACINIIPKIMSIYSWKEEVVEDTESILIMKTTANVVTELKKAFHEAHPYEVPEFVVLDIDTEHSSQSYVDWVGQITQGFGSV